MSLPTLLKQNVIIPHMKESKNDISNITGIDFIMKWFEKRIDNPTLIKNISDKIIILKSATGSGKSTVLPAEFYLRFQNKLRKNIIVTQPRILTAISIPKDIANIPSYQKKNRTDNMGIELYKNIGYQTKEYVRKGIEKGILFCTIGILLQFLKNSNLDILFNKYGIIIIDEAHERSANLDLIFYYLKNIYNTYPLDKCPFLIIASATMNVNKYAKYYNTKTIFEIIGTSYPIESHFLKYNSLNIYNSIIDTIKNIHLNNIEDNKDRSDIIIFIPSQSYITKIKNKILELNQELEHKLFPISLDSESYKLAGADYNALFENIDKLTIDGKYKVSRKIIIATNIAETGITINSLKYCIDTGLVNQLEYNPILNSYNLLVKPVSQSMALQRKGRVGRKFPGEFYPIYTKETFNNLIEIQYPDILNEDLSLIILNIIIIKYSNILDKYIKIDNLFQELINNTKYDDIKFLKNIDVTNIDLLDKLPNISINNALNKLYIYGLIYANGYPTQLGLISNKIRGLSIENIKMIMAGYYHNCNIIDLITIAAYNTIGKSKLTLSKFKSFNTQFKNIYDNENIDNYNYNKLKTRLFINCEFIDFLLFFYEFQLIIIKYKSNIAKIKEYCLDNKINYTTLMNLIELRDEIIKDFCLNMNINPFYNKHINLYNLINSYNKNENLFIEAIEEIIKIKKSIYDGFKLNIAIYDDSIREYKIPNTNYIINIDSYLTNNLPLFKNGKNFEINKPQIVLYDSLIIKKNNINNTYNFTIGNSITVLSGYINVDLNF